MVSLGVYLLREAINHFFNAESNSAARGGLGECHDRGVEGLATVAASYLLRAGAPPRPPTSDTTEQLYVRTDATLARAAGLSGF